MIGRRAFLRGAGAAFALPWLESLRPLSASEPVAGRAVAPIRTVNCYFGNGVNPETWFPKGAGGDFDLPFCLQPLRGLRERILVFDGVRNVAARKGHQAAGSQWTCLPVSNGRLSAGGPSFDQILADQVGTVTPLPSLELAVDPPPNGAQLHFHYLSWRSADKPMARETDPRAVFERLFGAKDANGKPLPQRPLADDRSLLDLVLDDARRVQRNLSSVDKAKVEEYLESIRGVERRIDFASRPDTRLWRPPTRPERLVPPPDTRDPGEKARLMCDLLVLALWTDSTRVATLLFENEAINRNFKPYLPELTVAAHHTNSHHQGDPAMIDNYNHITRWFVAQYAYLCERLAAIQEGERSLLDNSMVTVGTCMDDGNRHSSDRVPLILAGSAGGRLRTGRCLRYPTATPLAALYLGMMRRAGATVDEFAGMSEELPGLDGGDAGAVPAGRGNGKRPAPKKG